MSIRRHALEVLTDVTDGGAYANLRLKSAQSGLSPVDAHFMSALVYNTLDHLLYLDHVIAAYAPQRQKKAVRGILRLGACELLFMSTPAHAAVSEYVALSREIGKGAVSGFINAVLRRIDRQRDALPPLPEAEDERLSVQYSHPLWLVRMWLAEHGLAETESLLSAAPLLTCIRAQYPLTTDALLSALPCPAERGRMDENCLRLSESLDVASLPLFRQGGMAIQGEGAMLACRALGDCRGKHVLDVCAAPGGKSAYIASLAQNDVRLTCFELHEHRTALLKNTLERLRVYADIQQRDASVHDPVLDSTFDAVLIDAPCSGLGLLAGKPDLRYSKSEQDIESLTAVQAAILDACAPYVRPGGMLVYSTCTISQRENERQVASFLSRHGDYSLSPLPFYDGASMQLLPHKHGTEGFFIARMQRCT